MTNEQLITEYLNKHQLAWAPTTIKAAHDLLNKYGSSLNGNPSVLWKAMAHLKPYSKVTVWSRVTDFWQWLIDTGHVTGPNPYKQFREENARQFKHTYQRKTPKTTFAEALARIESLKPEHKTKALQLLQGGLRFSESFSIEDGIVTGKGGKKRECFASASHPGTDGLEYRTFLRALKKVGLKPHDLRKIFLNECVNQGADPFQLMEIAGWSNLNTAQSYIEANRTKLRLLVSKVQEGLVHGVTEKQVS